MSTDSLKDSLTVRLSPRFLRLMCDARGFGLMQSMFAAGIITMVAVGLGGIFMIVGKNSEKVRLFSAGITIEASLLTSLQDSASFVGVAAGMSQGAAPTGLVLRSDQKTIAIIGTPVFADISGHPCSGFGQGACLIKVETDIRCGSGGGGSSAVCNAAYRISFGGKLALAPLGVAGEGPFAEADYIVPISVEQYLRKASYNCGPAEDIAASGFDRDTGELHCISKPRTSCPANTIAKSIRVVAGSFETQCVPMQTLACPTNYVLQTFSPSSLENGQPKNGTCVFVTAREVPWRTTPAKAPSVSGQFCPPSHYRAVASCQVVDIQQTQGQCPSYSCPPCDVTPDGQTVCNTCTPPPNPPANVGAYTLTTNGPSANCAIANGGQTCGASWTGNVVMTGTCVLIDPETVVAQ